MEIDNPAYILYRGVEKRDDDDILYEDNNIAHPITDCGIRDPAPYVILVQGPPNVGKSLLVKSLVKYFTKKQPTDVRGPITVASGKRRRLQFVECPDDIDGMIDAAKYADVTLLLIDASYGFQMETFEFLNLLRVHGFPKVFGVFTHLDGVKHESELNETKERFQNNFWTEIAEGAKLFYFSGLEDELYKISEIQQLADALSSFELLPSPPWRAAHPYVVVDRVEDVTPTERVQMDNKCDRNILLYGYLRGNNGIKTGAKVHIAGVGDFHIADIRSSTDPFPLSSEIEGGNYPADLRCLEIEGFSTGDYMRLEVHDVPFGMVEDFDPCHPILVGGISLEEDNSGFMQVKLKRQRWHMKLLNTGDQIIVSAGWRRYVTTPIYAMENSENGYHRILKYTPEHRHCLATFWGPVSPPHTRIAVVRSVPDDKEEFRITAKGVVLDFNHAREIVKKTTMKGTPCKIFKNDAFIKFTSGAETGRLRGGASVRTTSGIRGKVDEAVNGGEMVKCTFKRKIRESDVVLLPVLTRVDVPHLVNQFTATLGSHDFIVPAETDPLKIDYHGQRWHIVKRRRVLIKEGEPFFLTSSNTLEGIYWREGRMRRMKRKETHESKEEEARKRKKMSKKIKKKKVFEPKPLWNEDGSIEFFFFFER